MKPRSCLLPLALRAALVLLAVLSPGRAFAQEAPAPGDPEKAEEPEDPATDPTTHPPIINPYYTHSEWRVWRDDATPVENVTSLVREGKENKPTTITLQPTPVADRIYPIVPQEGEAPVQWRVRAAPSDEFAGVWDDVYASWSGLHGYVRPLWQAVGNNKVQLRPKRADQFMHFVEARKTSDLLRCGVNFVHQSTTGMGHTITNGFSVPMTGSYEKVYFSDCLVTAPAHASFTEDWADRTKDLYLALVPTLFNSVGSSNSETMAITKWLVVGGYLPPETKRLLKLHGLYPGALLYLWKSALPYDVPYDHELRHRIAYRALGHEGEFGGRYGHAGHERGNLALEFHRYSEIAHMRNMIRAAQTMTVMPPEAVFDSAEAAGGKPVYGLRKAVLVLQEPGEDVTIHVTTGGCYDLQDRPVTVRWKLLYGNHATTCVPGEEADTWTIHVPWDDTLPEGRTALALIANNGVHDSNPAIVNVYRKYGDLPPSGAGGKGGGYGYTSKTANRRPVILGVQDVVVKPGAVVRLPLRAVDPERQPVRFYKRAGEPGELDGNLFTWKVPRDVADEQLVTFIASDATAGNSYAVKQVRFVVKPELHAHIESDMLVGPAPLTVAVNAKDSVAPAKAEFGWEFYTPKPQRKAAEWKDQTHGETADHTFEKPGLYEVALTVRSGERSDVETVRVWVTKEEPPKPLGGVWIEGNGVRIAAGDDEACAFDHTDFGVLAQGATVSRVFELHNLGGDDISCPKGTVSLSGEDASDFRIVRAPRKTIEAGGYATFEIELRPSAAGRRSAVVTVKAGGTSSTFRIAGELQPE